MTEKDVAARLGALADTLGGPIRLETVVTEQAAAPATAEAASGEEGSPEAPARVTREEVERVNREPIVNTLKELFEARLVNIERT